MKQAKKPVSNTGRPAAPKPKLTRQGDGLRSKPNHRRKLSQGQGR